MTAPPVRPAPPPAGTLPWHAWLYTPGAGRDVAAACFALDAEWQSLVHPRIDHGVAHLKLQWWRDELARLSRGGARHPLTQALSRQAPVSDAAWQALADALTARQFELASASYESDAELDGYLSLADGSCRALAILLAPDADPAAVQAAGREIGRAVRQVEIIRDLRQDAVSGRIQLPLAWLAEQGISHVDLQSADPPAGARRCLERLAGRARTNWHAAQARLDDLRREELRGLRVFGELHAALLARIAHASFAVGRRRIALGPAASLWTAWRAARQH